jgi:hypothetical protein
MVFSKTILFSVTTLLSACVLINGNSGAQAHELDEGIDLGASIKVISKSPVSAVVTIVPRVNFSQVTIELPNTTTGPKTSCVLGSVVARQRYTCNVSADVSNSDTGLVVNIVGVYFKPTHGHDTAMRSYTINNPQFSAEAQQQKIQSEQAVKVPRLKSEKK